MDTGAYLRSIWIRRWAVLVAGGVTGLLVLGVLAAVPTVWTASSQLFVTAGEGGDERSVERLSSAYVAFAEDPRVQAAAQRGVPVGPRSGAGRRTETRVEDLGEGRLQVTARAGTAEDAVARSLSLARALSVAAEQDAEQALRRDLAPLDEALDVVAAGLADVGSDDLQERLLLSRQERLDQARVDLLARPRAHLDLVSAARLVDASRSPAPVRGAALAAVVAALLAAQVAALLGVRRRGLEAVEPVATLHDWTGLPVFRVQEDTAGDQSAAALRSCTSSPAGAPGPVVHVASLDGLDVARLEPLRRAAQALLGADTLVVDGSRPQTLERTAARVAANRPALVLAGPWNGAGLLRLTREVPGPCLLAVERGRVRRAALREAVRVMSAAGTPPVGLLLVEGPPRPAAALVDAPAARPVSAG